MTRLRPPGFAGHTAQIYILPVIRIDRGLYDGANGVNAKREFCREQATPRPAPGSRPQLIVDNGKRPPAANFDFLDRPDWWLGA